MKNAVSILAMIVASGVGLPSASVAEEQQSSTDSTSFLGGVFAPKFHKPFGVSVGLKTWFNKWQTSGWTGEDIKDHPGLVNSMTSATRLGPIPVLSFRYNNFFVSGSYYIETDFTFPRHSFGTVFELTDGKLNAEVTKDISAKRTEWDISVGYYISRYLALTAGYKEIEQDFTNSIIYWVPSQSLDDGTFYIAQDGPYVDHSTTRISGPTIGLAGSVPIKSGWGVYGTLGYGFLETKFESGGTYDSPYYLIESGISYTSSEKGKGEMVTATTFYAGYRSQTFYTENITPSGEDGTDITEGFVFGLNVSF